MRQAPRVHAEVLHPCADLVLPWDSIQRITAVWESGNVLSCSNTCARKEVSVLVERYRHDAVCGIEGLLHTITMMNVNVNIQDPVTSRK